MSQTKTKENNFTEGPILVPLLKFALPVLAALVLQAMYGAVDLWVVGKFASSADVSAVSTGSQFMTTITSAVASFAMGITILLGQQIGQGKQKEGGRTIGAGIVLFLVLGAILTVFMVLFAQNLSGILNAPTEAFDKTTAYLRICGGGCIIIIAYNLIGSIFRGMGDSKTPLITVLIACIVNIAADLFFVAGLGLGTAGAAIATVLAQCISVIISLLLIRRMQLPFTFEKSMIKADKSIIGKIVQLGFPVALQDLLVGISFLVIAAIVNSLGLIPSAGVGVAEKVCAFIMLIPSSFMQSLAAIVAQNYGAGKMDRAYRTLRIAMTLSIIAGLSMFFLTFFKGNLLAGLFSNDAAVVEAAFAYLRAYAIDCIFTAFMFCFVGFFNGIGATKFVMIQGICGAFLVRVPVSFLMSRIRPVSIFLIGLATPCSTVVQIILCIIYFVHMRKMMSKSEIQ